MKYRYLVKLFSPWHTKELVYGQICFSPHAKLNESDAALWEYWPNETILDYKGPKAWYSWEPRWHSQYKTRLVKKVRANLKEAEWLHYAHSNLKYRVPHITNCGATNVYNTQDRLNRAVAIVSNSGGQIWFLRSGLRLRNSFVTHPLIELWGRKLGWNVFRRWGPLSKAEAPSNYYGELDWKDAWMSEEQIRFLSRYHVSVCLENSIEPYYFTEKFLNAVRAGCIPVYHAHPTVRDGILKGAVWVDPAHYDFNVERTLNAALDSSLTKFQATNQKWLEKGEVKETHFNNVWNRLAEIYYEKLSN